MDMAATYSYINMILLSVIGGAFFLLCTVMGYWASSVNKQLHDIYEDQENSALKVNGLDQWAKNHDKQDDERHLEIKRRADAISRDIMNLIVKSHRREIAQSRMEDEGEQ